MSAIGKKILAVMEGIEKVSKDKKNSFHNYNYASDEAIVGAIREVLIKNGLIVTPSQLECHQTGELTTLAIEYTLLDVDSGEKIVSKVYGQGQDKGDKGVYKAATGAEKYFLLKTFLIPTTDDPEANGYRKPLSSADATSEHSESHKSEENVVTPSGIKAFKSKKGTTYYKMMDQEGVNYTIFDEAVAHIAKKQAELGKPVKIQFESDKFGLKINHLTAL